MIRCNCKGGNYTQKFILQQLNKLVWFKSYFRCGLFETKFTSDGEEVHCHKLFTTLLG